MKSQSAMRSSKAQLSFVLALAGESKSAAGEETRIQVPWRRP